MHKTLAFTAALLASTIAARAETVINVAHVLGDTSSYQVTAERLAELVAERSNGEMKIEIFGNSALGGELRLAQGLRSGTVDIAFVSTASLEGIIPETKIFALPYLFDSKQSTYDILASDLGTELLATFANYDIIGLGWGAIYERSMPSMRPVETLADLDGMKIRTIQSTGYVAAYEALGMQPTPLAYGELFLALEAGIVDAAELAPDQTVGDGFAQAIGHYALTRVHMLPAPLLGAPALMNRLTDAETEILMGAIPEALQAGIDAHNAATDAALETMRANGIVVTEPDLAPFREAARTAWPVIVAELPGGEETLAKWQAAIAE
ncbi:TRAP transporter substrate-binding protein [Ketogulonicigenium vulgare]|uniref:TRAP transporter substrate-binding protein n=1 Tax=Ketogulonicigenium vulgare TaxID=92945 RepID=UPI0023585541|nr:TRAP transporter substrate-binding protein [Ketogulonicigenium vulgare]